MIETITIDTEQWAVVPRTLLEEIAESLACELDARYPACNRSYPSQERKYLAEMEPVIKAREILAAAPRHEAGQQTCTVCHGQTGYEADELYGDRVTGRHWVDCDHCKGDGVEPQQSAPRPEAWQQSDPWVPSVFNYDRSIHSNPDAKAWADLFVQTFPGLAGKHDLMLGWFANAMMAMHDHLAKQQPATRPVPTCETCNGNGMIGGPSYYQPDEGGVPCPDCAAPRPVPTSERVSIDPDALSNYIRIIDGCHVMGTGELAEKIAAWVREHAIARPAEPDGGAA